jgi:hypothetical protein
MIVKQVPMKSVKKSDFAELVKYITNAQQKSRARWLRDRHELPFRPAGRGHSSRSSTPRFRTPVPSPTRPIT